MKLKVTSLFIVLFSFSNVIMAQLKSVDYADGNQKLSGFIAKPSKAIKDNPGILILPAWMGIDDHSKESADDLAKLGYYSFVADIYGVGNKPTNTSEAGQKAGYFKKKYSGIPN